MFIYILVSDYSGIVEVVNIYCFFFFQAEDGIRDLVRSRGLGDVYKRQGRAGTLGEAAEKQPRGYGEAIDPAIIEVHREQLALSLIHI